MKKVKFAIALLLLLVFATFSFAACNDSGGKRKIPGWEEGKTNIVYYTWGSNEELALFQDIVDEFEKENPDYNIIISKAGNDYYGDLELRLTGKQAPDIVQMKPGYIQSYLKSGALISLQDYIQKSTVISDDMIWSFNDGYRYNPQTKEIGNHNDDLYCLIKDFSCDFVMNYNKNMVTSTVAQASYPKQGDTNYPSETVPMTWSQYMDFAGAMQSGATKGAALDNEPFQQLLEWVEQAGGSLYSADGTSVNDIATTPELRQAFDYYRMLRDKCSKSPTFKTTYDASKVSSDWYLSTDVATAQALSALTAVQVGPGQLKQGQAASIFYGRWAYTTYNTDNNVCSTGFAPPPVPNNLVVEEDTKFAGITAMVGMAITKKSANPDGAFKFLEYYFTKGQDIIAKQGFNIPGNKQVAETTFVNDESISQKTREVNKFFYDLALNHGFVIKYNQYMPQSVVENVLSAELSSYFAKSEGKAFNEANWVETLNTITKELNKNLANYVK